MSSAILHLSSFCLPSSVRTYCFMYFLVPRSGSYTIPRSSDAVLYFFIPLSRTVLILYLFCKRIFGKNHATIKIYINATAMGKIIHKSIIFLLTQIVTHPLQAMYNSYYITFPIQKQHICKYLSFLLILPYILILYIDILQAPYNENTFFFLINAIKTVKIISPGSI